MLDLERRRAMSKSDVITLVSELSEKNDKGVFEPVESHRDVFCSVSSTSSTEWFSGRRMGLNPQKQFIVFAGDYRGEEICIYHGQRLTIYRTYERDDDHIELYTEKRKGNE